MDIAELLPQKSESVISNLLSGITEHQLSKCSKPMQEAILEVVNAFEKIDSDFIRHKIKVYMCDKSLLEAEVAIEKQYKLALSGDQTALKNVQSGMQYWQNLIENYIKRCLNAC